MQFAVDSYTLQSYTDSCRLQMYFMINTTLSKAKVTLAVPDELLTEAKILAVRQKTSLSAVVETALQAYLEQKEEE